MGSTFECSSCGQSFATTHERVQHEAKFQCGELKRQRDELETMRASLDDLTLWVYMSLALQCARAQAAVDAMTSAHNVFRVSAKRVAVEGSTRSVQLTVEGLPGAVYSRTYWLTADDAAQLGAELVSAALDELDASTRRCTCGNPSPKYYGPHDPDCPAA